MGNKRVRKIYITEQSDTRRNNTEKRINGMGVLLKHQTHTQLKSQKGQEAVN